MSETEDAANRRPKRNHGGCAAVSIGSEVPAIRRSATLRTEAHRLTKLIGSSEELEALIQRESELGLEYRQHQARYNAVRGEIDDVALRIAATPISTIGELTVLLGAAAPYLALVGENEPRDVLTQAIIACTLRLLLSFEGNRRSGDGMRRGTFSWFVRGWRERSF